MSEPWDVSCKKWHLFTYYYRQRNFLLISLSTVMTILSERWIAINAKIDSADLYPCSTWSAYMTVVWKTWSSLSVASLCCTFRCVSALPLVYCDNHNHLSPGSVHKWREPWLRRCKARLRCCSVKPLWNKREKKPHIQAAQIWGSGGFVLLWSMTRASMKIALCLKCMVWQLAIKTSSGVMHGGVWRPEDLLSKLCTYCRSGCTVMEIFRRLKESCLQKKEQKKKLVTFVL